MAGYYFHSIPVGTRVAWYWGDDHEQVQGLGRYGTVVEMHNERTDCTKVAWDDGRTSEVFSRFLEINEMDGTPIKVLPPLNRT